MAQGFEFDPNVLDNIALAAGTSLGIVLDEMADDARRACPYDSGDLHDSIEPERITPTHGRVWVGTDHWAATEYGSMPHEIRSTGPWPLRDDAGNVFGRVVQHPGTPAQPFMRPALYRRRTLRAG